MRTVYKYQFQLADETILFMPRGSTFLHVGEQDGLVTIWALVDQSAELEPRKFYVYGTGNPVPNGVGFLGTFRADPFVWHVFYDEFPVSLGERKDDAGPGNQT
jgi:hypothetical protein